MTHYLHPDASVPVTAPEDRFSSMSLTRNSAAVIHEPRRVTLTRVPNSLTVDDIAGARPRALPLRPRREFHDTGDIEGARPKLLHRESNYRAADVEGASC